MSICLSIKVATAATPVVAIFLPFRSFGLVILGLLNSHWCTRSLTASATFKGALLRASTTSALVPATVKSTLPAINAWMLGVGSMKVILRSIPSSFM